MASTLARLISLALLGSFAAGAPGQDAPPPPEPAQEETTPILTEEAPSNALPSAESLFERHIAAIGGHDAVFAQKNRRITGVFEGKPFNFPARLTTWLEAPDRLYSKISEPAGRTILIGYDGQTAWRRIDGGPVAILEGSAAANLRDAADFYGQANYKSRYASIQTIGAGQLLGRDVYIVRAVWPSGEAELVLFDKAAGFYVGVQYRIPVQEGEPLEILTVVDGYKDVGGAKYPTKITQMSTDGKVMAKYEYRDIRVDVDDGFDGYSPPEGVETTHEGG